MAKQTKKKRKKADPKKSGIAETEKRVNSVYLLLLQGQQRKSILQYCAKKYGVKERTIDNYIKKARSQMSKDQKVDLDLKKNEIISQLYDLYQKNQKSGDYRECRNILKEISEILGVKAAVKTETTVDLKYTKEEIKKINEELENEY